MALGTGGAACSGSPPSELTGGAGPGSGAASGGAGGAFVDSGKELWTALESDMMDACGACHDAGGIGDAPFLAGPDRYASVLAWPGVVVSDPAASLLLTYPISGGGHTGINLDTQPGDLLARVEAWLVAEAGAIPETPEGTPFIEPFTPILGFNAVYLNEVDDALEGVALTFTAEELTASTLKLTGVEVHTTAKTGVHIVHPVFGVYPKGGEAESDPVDSFGGLDHKFAEATSEALGPGTLLLTNWQVGAKIGIGFELCAPFIAGGGEGGAGGGSGGGCEAVAEFTASAAPRLMASCAGCHGGADPQANAAVDMSGLGSDDAAACAQVKNRVDLANPAASQVFVNTDPGGNAAHPFKFLGNAAQWEAFKADVSVWIQAESQ
jgi:hypothetical protein